MYSHKFGEEPEWGVTGKGIATEGFTQVSLFLVICNFSSFFRWVPSYQFIMFLITSTEFDVLHQCSLTLEAYNLDMSNEIVNSRV